MSSLSLTVPSAEPVTLKLTVIGNTVLGPISTLLPVAPGIVTATVAGAVTSVTKSSVVASAGGVKDAATVTMDAVKVPLPEGSGV